jgi:hypothetical protein
MPDAVKPLWTDGFDRLKGDVFATIQIVKALVDRLTKFNFHRRMATIFKSIFPKSSLAKSGCNIRGQDARQSMPLVRA